MTKTREFTVGDLIDATKAFSVCMAALCDARGHCRFDFFAGYRAPAIRDAERIVIYLVVNVFRVRPFLAAHYLGLAEQTVKRAERHVRNRIKADAVFERELLALRRDVLAPGWDARS